MVITVSPELLLTRMARLGTRPCVLCSTTPWDADTEWKTRMAFSPQFALKAEFTRVLWVMRNSTFQDEVRIEINATKNKSFEQASQEGTVCLLVPGGIKAPSAMYFDTTTHRHKPTLSATPSARPLPADGRCSHTQHLTAQPRASCGRWAHWPQPKPCSHAVALFKCILFNVSIH